MSEIPHAEIVDVLKGDGIKRVYRLRLLNGRLVEKGQATLHFGEFPSERQSFTPIPKDSVLVNAHNCRDFKEKIGGDIFYVWKPRLSRLGVSCPLCKSRFDAPTRRRGIA